MNDQIGDGLLFDLFILSGRAGERESGTSTGMITGSQAQAQAQTQAQTQGTRHRHKQQQMQKQKAKAGVEAGAQKEPVGLGFLRNIAYQIPGRNRSDADFS